MPQQGFMCSFLIVVYEQTYETSDWEFSKGKLKKAFCFF